MCKNRNQVTRSIPCSSSQEMVTLILEIQSFAHTRGVGYIYIFCQIFNFKQPVNYNTDQSLVILYLWLLVDPPDVSLVHYRKQEVAQLVSSMEHEFKIILRWMDTTPAEAPEASTQWGHSIAIVGNSKKVTSSKRKSFMVDMYGFETDGELAGVCNYLRSHGGFEIKQVPYPI